MKDKEITRKIKITFGEFSVESDDAMEAWGILKLYLKKHGTIERTF